MAQKMGHFSSRVSSEMMARRKCQFYRILNKILRKSWPIHLSPKNDPIWQLVTAKNCPNRGKNLALRRRPKMLQKIGHFRSRLAFKMTPRRNCHFSEFCGNPVRTTCLQKWPKLGDIHGSKLPKSWAKIRLSGGGQRCCRNGPFVSLVAPEMMSRQKCHFRNFPQF